MLINPTNSALDYAHGFNNNYQLPLGQFDRSCAKYKKSGKILCPNPNDPTREGVCDPKFAARNADTYSFIAVGVGLSAICGRDIPLPPPPPEPPVARDQTMIYSPIKEPGQLLTVVPAAVNTSHYTFNLPSEIGGRGLDRGDCDSGDDALPFDDCLEDRIPHWWSGIGIGPWIEVKYGPVVNMVVTMVVIFILTWMADGAVLR